MFCKYCGNEIQKEQEICLNCLGTNSDYKGGSENKIKEKKKTIIPYVPWIIVVLIILFMAMSTSLSVITNLMMILVLIFFIFLIALILGIINPNIVIIWGDLEKINRKSVLKYYGIGAIVLYIILRGCSVIMIQQYYTSTTNSKSASTGQQEEVQAIRVTPKELDDAYSANEVSADKKYKGKIAIITGKIDSIGVSSGKPVINLVDSSDHYKYTIATVHCYFNDDSQSNKIANLSKGQIVTIKGKITGQVITIGVDDCILQ